MHFYLTVILILTSVSLSLAQIGIKAGFSTPQGFHGGVSLEKTILEKAGVSLQMEGVYHNISYSRHVIEDLDSNKTKLKNDTYRTSIFQLPINIIKSFTPSAFTPFFKAGGGPSLEIVNNENKINGFALVGAGISYKKFRLEGIFNISLTNSYTITMVSASYFFNKG